jgi:hypothetical protein
MQKWYFDGWLTDISNGKDQLFHIHSATMNDADQGNTYYDGTQVGTVNGTNAHNTTYMPQQLQFGGWGTSTEYSKCEVAEFVAFNRVLTSSERQSIEGYLAHKWKLTSRLPAGHANKANPAGVGYGLIPDFTVASPTQTYPIPVSVTFKKGNTSTAVTGFAISDLNLTGASASGLSGSGHTYTFNLTPSTNPARISLGLNAGGVSSQTSGERNQQVKETVLYRPSVLKESNLALFFPLGEAENATTVQDWSSHGLTGTVAGTVGRFPGLTGSSLRFDGSANNKITIPNHRAMRMNSNGQYTANIWLRYEVGSSAWGAVFTRGGRNYMFSFGNNNNANGGYVHHRFRMGSNTNIGVYDA